MITGTSRYTDDSKISGSGFKASVMKICSGAELTTGYCSDFSFPKHAHEDFTLGIVLSGSETIYCNGTNEPAGRGSLYMYQPDQIHTGFSIGRSSWQFASLYLSTDFMTGLLDGQALEFGAPLTNDAFSAGVYCELLYILQTSECDVERRSALHTFATYISRRHGVAQRRGRTYKTHITAVNRAKTFVQSNYGTPILLKDIAAKAALHPSYFVESFKKSEGITPHAYLLSVRLNAARHSLIAGKRPADIAVECGFYDQSHLNRHFRKVFGLSPAKFQKQLSA